MESQIKEMENFNSEYGRIAKELLFAAVRVAVNAVILFIGFPFFIISAPVVFILGARSVHAK